MLRINWAGFARTGHWLRGLQLTAYLFAEHYAAHMAVLLEEPDLFQHFRHLEAHEAYLLEGPHHA